VIFRYLKWVNGVKVVREVQVKSLIDLLRLNNNNNMVNDYLDQEVSK